jgi:putative ABC transport system permease protein
MEPPTIAPAVQPSKPSPENRGVAPSSGKSPVRPRPAGRRTKLALGEILNFAYDTFCSNKVRFVLTSLGMVIGTASLILVTTISLTGKQYLLNQIQAIGSNWIYAEYQSGAQRITNTAPDLLTVEDLAAVRVQVPGIVAASPVIDLSDRIPVGGG